MARSHQPGLIIVDRWVTGRHENYLTPEQKIPAEPLDGPWETCMPMAGAWSYYPDDTYKPARVLLRQLADVVSRGGNYLLNIGVDGRGNLPADAVARLEDLAAWMRVNGEAIHGTRAMAPFRDGKCRLTRGKDGSVFAIYVADDQEEGPPSHILLGSQDPPPGTTVSLLGVDGDLAWRSVGKGILVELPAAALARPPAPHAWVLRIGG
jgi:alpha-L-fucosidase